MDVTNVYNINFGTLKLDGGAMFSIIPKSIWSRFAHSDENNLCTWRMNSLLVVEGNKKTLIDTGVGNKFGPTFIKHFSPEPNLWNQQNISIDAEQITDVILTHLHFDHVGGALIKVKDKIVPTFPNATYWTNKIHYHWAIKSNDRERASFLDENYKPLMNEGRLKFIDVENDVPFSDHINIRFFYGHTNAMMAPLIKTNNETILFCSDLLPSHGHIGLPYITSYDINPLFSVEEKKKTFEEAIEKNWTLFLQHDPNYQFTNLKYNERGKIVGYNFR